MVPWYRFQRVGMPFNIRERTKRARIERDGEARIVADVKGVAEVMVDISDGRRARSERSRQKIIDALFTLVQSGEMKPSAARVAATGSWNAYASCHLAFGFATTLRKREL